MLFLADINERLPIWQPLPKTIFDSELSEPGATFSHTSGAKYTLSPKHISGAMDRKMSQEQRMETFLPKAANGYVAFNHRVWSLVATLNPLWRRKSSETAGGRPWT
jgi:hypothetical protein